MPHFPFSKLFSIYPPSTILFSNKKVFFSKSVDRFYHWEQNNFSKHYSPSSFVPENACLFVRGFFRWVKEGPSTMCFRMGLVKGVTKSSTRCNRLTVFGTRCDKVWYKVQQSVTCVTGEVWKSLEHVVTGFGTRYDKVWYKVWQSLVQGVTKSGTRCDSVLYKVWQRSDHSGVQVRRGPSGSIQILGVWGR